MRTGFLSAIVSLFLVSVVVGGSLLIERLPARNAYGANASSATRATSVSNMFGHRSAECEMEH